VELYHLHVRVTLERECVHTCRRSVLALASSSTCFVILPRVVSSRLPQLTMLRQASAPYHLLDNFYPNSRLAASSVLCRVCIRHRCYEGAQCEGTPRLLSSLGGTA
jgi:hypothetical protein